MNYVSKNLDFIYRVLFRDFHSKEKEFLINEIKRLSKQNEYEMKYQQKEDVSKICSMHYIFNIFNQSLNLNPRQTVFITNKFLY